MTSNSEKDFFGREKEIAEFVRAVEMSPAAPRSHAVIGHRGVGKTEMLRQTAGVLLQKRRTGKRQLIIYELGETEQETDDNFKIQLKRAVDREQCTEQLRRKLLSITESISGDDSPIGRLRARVRYLLEKGHSVCIDEFQRVPDYGLEGFGKTLMDEQERLEVAGSLIFAGSRQQLVTEILLNPRRAMGGRIHGSRWTEIFPLSGKPLLRFAASEGWLRDPRRFLTLFSMTDGNPRRMWDMAAAMKQGDLPLFDRTSYRNWQKAVIRHEIEQAGKSIDWTGRNLKDSGLDVEKDEMWAILNAFRNEETSIMSWDALNAKSREIAEESYSDDEWRRRFRKSLEYLTEDAALLRPTRRNAKLSAKEQNYAVTSNNLALHLFAGRNKVDLDIDSLVNFANNRIEGFALEEITRGHLHDRAEAMLADDGNFTSEEVARGYPNDPEEAILARKRDEVFSRRGVAILSGVRGKETDIDAMAVAYMANRMSDGTNGCRLVSMELASCKRSASRLVSKGQLRKAALAPFETALANPPDLFSRWELCYLTKQEKTNLDGALAAKTRKYLVASDFGRIRDADKEKIMGQQDIALLDPRSMAQSWNIDPGSRLEPIDFGTQTSDERTLPEPPVPPNTPNTPKASTSASGN